jgi:hypothetical protein
MLSINRNKKLNKWVTTANDKGSRASQYVPLMGDIFRTDWFKTNSLSQTHTLSPSNTPFITSSYDNSSHIISSTLTSHEETISSALNMHGISSAAPSPSPNTAANLPLNPWRLLGLAHVCKDKALKQWERRILFTCDNYLFECPQEQLVVIGFMNLSCADIKLDYSSSSIALNGIKSGDLPNELSIKISYALKSERNSARSNVWIKPIESESASGVGDAETGADCIRTLQNELLAMSKLDIHSMFDVAKGPGAVLGRGTVCLCAVFWSPICLFINRVIYIHVFIAIANALGRCNDVFLAKRKFLHQTAHNGKQVKYTLFLLLS